MRLSIAHKSSVFSAGGDSISRYEPLTVANKIVRLTELMRFRVARAPSRRALRATFSSKEKEQHHTSLTYRE